MANKLEGCRQVVDRSESSFVSSNPPYRQAAVVPTLAAAAVALYTSSREPVCIELSGRKVSQVGNQLKFLIRNQNRRLSQAERERYESRMATVMKIYHKIISSSPLSMHVCCPSSSIGSSGSQSHNGQHNHISQMNMLECRQAVLDYIENLNGYCDSINILRQIMRSSSMTNVMQAFDCIVEKVLINQS